MKQTRLKDEDLSRIKELIEEVRFGSVTIVVHDGKVTQIEKNEKLRLSN